MTDFETEVARRLGEEAARYTARHRLDELVADSPLHQGYGPKEVTEQRQHRDRKHPHRFFFAAACLVVLAFGSGLTWTNLSSNHNQTDIDALGSTSVPSVVIPDGFVGQWVLADGYHEVLGLETGTVVSLTLTDLGRPAAPLGIEVSIGCGAVGGGTSPEDPLQVTEVTIQTPSCGAAIDQAETRVAFTVLSAMPSAHLNAGNLLIQTAQGQLTFRR